MLASQRAKEEEEEYDPDKARARNRMSAYFPLGYKEAAHQWVRYGHLS